ncbi:hypothetical protein GCM10025876_01680 [Demequina litorisediminis]|uniref:Glucokinase n=1 Tax=Demequina litorisediminis TaxID=1849022 RepID=A0ABQ6I8K8_9MICO|nr:hypothetical protein GCM10025876_01680 [Demequina litorisediminis]
MLFAPNIAWREYPLAQRVRDAIGRDDLTVVVENDANAAGWAEFAFGPAREASSVIMLTIGTGLGAAIISDGKPGARLRGLCRGARPPARGPRRSPVWLRTEGLLGAVRLRFGAGTRGQARRA